MINPNSPNQQQNSLNECNPKGPPVDVNLDHSPPYCEDHNFNDNNKRRINDDSLNYLKDQTMKKTGYGARVDCDPMQRGYIINDLENPDREHIYRYSKSVRGCDEAIKDMFNNLIVIDEDGKAWPVPVSLGPPEKAVAIIVQDNVRKDDTLVVERLKLPLLAVTQTNIDYDTNRFTYHRAINLFRNPEGHPGFTIKEKYDRDTIFGLARGVPINIGYTITAWTAHREDMNQIIEQILTKFSLAAYIRVTGVPWEIIVLLDSIANNLEAEPGDNAVRIIKYEFNITVQTYIPQPIERKKAVLKMKLDFIEGITEQEFDAVLSTIGQSVKELEC